MKLALDINLMQPGCALIQVAMGGTAGIASRFPTDSWVLSPTKDMKVYPITEEQLLILIDKVEQRRGSWILNG